VGRGGSALAGGADDSQPARRSHQPGDPLGGHMDAWSRRNADRSPERDSRGLLNDLSLLLKDPRRAAELAQHSGPTGASSDSRSRGGSPWPDRPPARSPVPRCLTWSSAKDASPLCASEGSFGRETEQPADNCIAEAFYFHYLFPSGASLASLHSPTCCRSSYRSLAECHSNDIVQPASSASTVTKPARAHGCQSEVLR
jgi:hypothetical protein